MIRNYTFFVAFVILLSLTHAAPSMQRHQRHIYDPYTSPNVYHTKMEWVNPCGGEYMATSYESTSADSSMSLRTRNPKALKPLREAIPNFLIRLNNPSMKAIDTNDVAQWFKYNNTYQFLHQMNTSSNVNLRRWHVESQVFVGAFQYLLHKQKLADQNRNDGNDKSMELQQLMILAKNLLCEIETAINNTRQLMPTVLSRKAMDQRLTFRNNNSNRFDNRDVDDLDNKFTKVRFHEYLHNMLQVMRRPGKKSLRQRKKKRNQLKHSQMMNSDSIDGSFNSDSAWSTESGPLGINANRNRLRKRNRNGRNRMRHNNNRIANNNIDNVNNDMSWTPDNTINDFRINGNGLNRNRNGMRRNNRNKERRMRQDGTMENGQRRRMHRKRTTTSTTTTPTPGLPMFFINNSE